MRTARADTVVELAPDRALALWRDVRRWSGFVEGFQRVESLSADWPAEGAKVVWASGAGGRGTVTEKVVAPPGPGGFATRVAEERLNGVQAVRFEVTAEGETLVRVSLEYELADENPLNRLADVLFIRRALRDMLRRTLRHFAVEAGEDAALTGSDSVTG